MASKNISIVTGDNNTPVTSRTTRRSDIDNGNKSIPLYIHSGHDNANPYYSFPHGSPENKIKGGIDVVNRGGWTQSPIESREHVVPIIITEYQPKYSSVLNNLLKNGNILAQFADQAKSVDVGETLGSVGGAARGIKAVTETYLANPIANSFQANKTGFSYKLPYLKLDAQSYATMFNDGDEGKQNVLSKALDFTKSRLANNASAPLKGAGGLFVLAGSLGNAVSDIASSVLPAINPANARDQFYKGSSPVSYELKLELMNNMDFQQMKFHKELIELWTHQMGMGDLRTPYVGDSPCIYSIEIPQIRWCPAAKIDFSYEGVGNLTYIDGVPYPEGYLCTFSVTEFFPPIRSVYHHYVKYGEKFMAITTQKVCEQVNSVIKSAGDLVKGLFS
jgi:hypothetical protein